MTDLRSPELEPVEIDSLHHDGDGRNERISGLAQHKSCLVRALTRCGQCFSLLGERVFFFQRVPHDRVKDDMGDVVTL